MTQRFYEIARIGTGILFIGPRPSAETLDSWCRELADLGISQVVSFIGDDEVADYGLAGEGLKLQEHGVAFTHFPIVDFGAPKGAGYRELVLSMHDRLKAGETVMAHCAGGIGRAGTFASCLLVSDGMPADEAMRTVSKKRGASAPESEGQRAFVRDFEPRHSTGGV